MYKVTVKRFVLSYVLIPLEFPLWVSKKEKETRVKGIDILTRPGLYLSRSKGMSKLQDDYQVLTPKTLESPVFQHSAGPKQSVTETKWENFRLEVVPLHPVTSEVRQKDTKGVLL